MGDKTGIEWTDATWNPTTGCDKVSPGCDNCYALTLAPRLKAMGSAHYQQDGDPKTSGPGFGIAMHGDALDKPLRWTRPRRIFVNSMSDLFHSGVTRDFQAQVFAVMALAPQHTFQVLTKRPGVMRSVLTDELFRTAVHDAAYEMWQGQVPELVVPPSAPTAYRSTADALREPGGLPWPLPNVWLGTSVEDQKRADLRISALADTPAAVRFLSCEPLLGPVDLTTWLPQQRDFFRGGGVLGLLSQGGRCDFQPGEHGASTHKFALCRQCTNGRRISWVIVGGESGRGARPMDAEWVRSLRAQCTDAGVAFHFKQWGSHDEHGLPMHKKLAGRILDGRTWDEFPRRDPSDGSIETVTS